MKLILLLIIFISFIDAGVIHPVELDQPIAIIQQIPQARALLEADTEILVANIKDCPWRALLDDGKIIVNRSQMTDENALICSILFELHNKARQEEIATYYELARKNAISCDHFVESIERIEHENLLATAKVINEAIQLGLLPQDVNWPIVHEFETHYQIQQLAGHSMWLAKRYHESGEKSPFIGTIHDIERLSNEDKRLLMLYLGARDNIQFNEKTRERFTKRIEKEYELAQNDPNRTALLRRVFMLN